MENVTELKKIEELRGKNVILLFGKTRAGKSTFINDAYEKKVAKSTTSIESDTNEISYVNRPIRIGHLDVLLVDTIGLGGSGKNYGTVAFGKNSGLSVTPEDHDRISFTQKWLDILYPGKRKIALEPTVKGILYFIDIWDAAMNEDNIRNLETFKSLVGKKVLGSVAFVTAKWAMEADKTMRKRNAANFVKWGENIRRDFPGASLVRLDDTTGRLDEEDLNDLSPAERRKKKEEYHNNAMRVLQQLLNRPATQPLLAQSEMNHGLAFPEAMGETTLWKTTFEHLSKDVENAVRRNSKPGGLLNTLVNFTKRSRS
ncbi:hypothetical protein DL96DRAFT_1824316 [Flagelloscypha sp. PMI_526]|nr:hypothetical protein DL96DRAFT_1824316 [Flagelloscypha sp. PMI_526]